MSRDVESGDLSFAALDALLERALEFDETESAAFLDSLEPIRRDALIELLQESASGSLARFGNSIQAAIRREDFAADGTKTTIGDWQLVREVGSGGTGQVFYAERHEASEGTEPFVQRAAIKVLWSYRVASQFRERFLRERRILASLDHPGLARFLDGGLLEDGRPWYAMEFVDGEDIVSYAKSLSVDERLSLFLAVADTIDYAHQRLIVHRDIKPQNILVDERGEPRVLDFGIAGLLGEYENRELTLAKGAPLTLQYASPEQVTSAPIAVSSDVYQLGLLLYEVLAQQKPYALDGVPLRDAVATISQHVPPAPGSVNRELPRDLDAIVGKALRKEPGERYSSAAALAVDVRRFVEGRPVSARPPSKLYVLRCFLRRNALVSVITAVSFVALAAATVFSLQQAAEARAEASRSRATQEILADVFEQADPFGEGGANITLADALIRAQPAIAARVANDPQLAWEVNRTLAGIFTNLDMLELERQAFEAAWDAARRLDGDNEAERFVAIAGIGNILVRTDPAEGVAFFAEHLPAAPSSKRGAVEWLSAKYAETSAYLRLRDTDKVDEGAKAMASVADTFEVDAPRTLGRIDQLQAGAARRAGDVDAADAHWDSAVANMRRADAPLALAVTLSNYALHYGMTGRFDASAAAFEESLDIFRSHETDNTSHANVLRTYAGLLFRMRQPERAQAALDEALAILDPAEQAYAVFVAQLERANFAFASGNIDVAFDAIAEGLGIGATAFGPDADVTRRILPVFARLLLFAGRTSDAARLIGVGDTALCGNDARLADDVERASSRLADSPQTEAAREALQEETDALRVAAAGGALAVAEVDAAMAGYRGQSHVFLDPLDRHRFIAALSTLSAGDNGELRAEHERLRLMAADAARLFESGSGSVRLQRLLQAAGVNAGGHSGESCQ